MCIRWSLNLGVAALGRCAVPDRERWNYQRKE